jgi:hypothetical protein
MDLPESCTASIAVTPYPRRYASTSSSKGIRPNVANSSSTSSTRRRPPTATSRYGTPSSVNSTS